MKLELFMQPNPSHLSSLNSPILQTQPQAQSQGQSQAPQQLHYQQPIGIDPLSLSRNTSHSTSSQPHSPNRTWLDKLMDTVIGDVGGPSSKYALVCEQCFTHNGLVLPELYPSRM